MVKTTKVTCQNLKFHEIQHKLFNSQSILMIKCNILGNNLFLQHMCIFCLFRLRLLHSFQDWFKPVLIIFFWFWSGFFGFGNFQDQLQSWFFQKSKRTGTRPDFKALNENKKKEEQLQLKLIYCYLGQSAVTLTSASRLPWFYPYLCYTQLHQVEFMQNCLFNIQIQHLAESRINSEFFMKQKTIRIQK